MPMRMSRKASDLWKSVLAGAKRRWGRTLSKEIKARLWTEMSAYIRVGACDYLALIRDMCRAARYQGFVVGAGRGAAVGSAVCSALGITGIDPIRHGLLFERFLCGRKNEFPDIDFEFDREGRDWARDWVVRRFGADRVAHIMYRLPEPNSKAGFSVHPSAVAISDGPHDRLSRCFRSTGYVWGRGTGSSISFLPTGVRPKRRACFSSTCFRTKV